MRMDEQELMARVCGGDEAAFARIMGLYKDKIVNYLYQFTGDYQKAVELSQETFLRVYFKAGKYKPIAPLSSWIYAIATNLARTEMKKARKFAQVSLEDVSNRLEPGAFSRDPVDSGWPGIFAKPSIPSIRATGPCHSKRRRGLSQEEIASGHPQAGRTVKGGSAADGNT